MSQVTTGDFTTGRCLGAVSKTRRFDDGNTRTDWFVGIQCETPTGFDEMDLKTIRFKLSKSQVDSGLQNAFNQLKGKVVSVPFFTVDWANGNGQDRYVARGYVPAANK